MNRQSTGASLHQRPEAVTDLSTLSPLSDDIIISCIHECSMSNNIYTNIGSSVIVAINIDPHKYVPTNSDSAMHKYAADYRDTFGGEGEAATTYLPIGK